MSGPKCDNYMLTPEERRRQQLLHEERLRREREEKRRIAQEKRRRAEEERKKREAAEKKRTEEFDREVDATLAELALLRRMQEEKEHKKLIDKLMDEFFEAYEEYMAAASAMQCQPENFEFMEDTAESDIEKMKELTESLNTQAVDNLCQQEVNRIVNETIADMGYEVLGERDGAGNANAVLYKYNDSTAINVINNGTQFVMEVVATDSKDRKATEEERNMLHETMGQFCTDYEAIMDRLDEDKRLTRSQVYHMKPDVKYAHVLNTSTYIKKRNSNRYMQNEIQESASRKETLRSDN